MFLLYAKKEYSAPVFDYIKTVETEVELDQWIEKAVDFFEGVAWLEVQEGQNAKYRTFEYDRKNHTVSRRASYTHVKTSEDIKKITNFYIDDRQL